ncbi:MAG TPA: terminase small subunit [Sedimentisphaerales bacterium]|nr:terminase small subunit [Sedimentisphaerales bacterium]
MTRLNNKQKAFCREYIKDWNATKAAKRTGYSPKTAYSQGQRLLKNVEVRAEIDRLSADITVENKVEVKEIISGLKAIAFASDDARVNNSDRLRALELLGKYKNIFTERKEHVVRPFEPPQEPEERKKWLQGQLALLESAESAGNGLVL